MPPTSVFAYIDAMKGKLESTYEELRKADDLLESQRAKEGKKQVELVVERLYEILGYVDLDELDEDEDEDEDEEEDDEDYDDEDDEEEAEDDDEEEIIAPGSLEFYLSEIESLLEESLDCLETAAEYLEKKNNKKAQSSVKEAIEAWGPLNGSDRGGESTGCIGGVCPIHKSPEKDLQKERKKLKEVLSSALKDDIATALDNIGMDSSGNKPELVARLMKARGDSPEEALMAFTKEALQAICDKNELPRAGNKNELASLIVSALVSEGVPSVSAEEFNSFVSGQGLALVDMYQDDCPGCEVMDVTIIQVMKEMGDRVRFGRFNIYEDEEITDRYDVDETPTLLLFDDGKLVGKKGPMSKNKLIDWLTGR